jgi:hypothetical protein
VKGAAFYSYMAPTPENFANAQALPKEAVWSKELGEFLLMYDTLRTLASPEEGVLDFCQSTYEAGATLGRWDRAALEITASSQSAKRAS